MSDANQDFSGSSARHHEQTGGNVPKGKTTVPFGGDAARQAQADGEATNEAHGIRTAPPGEFRAARSLTLPNVRGARLAASEEPRPDLSQRTAADYLPPHLKAQLIAEGKLPAPPGYVPPETAPVAVEPNPTPAEEPKHATKGLRGSLSTLLRKLF